MTDGPETTRSGMPDGLVGYTGFVGGNLLLQHDFAGRYNRANISELKGAEFDRLVVSAVPAEMWLANRNPEADRQNILDLFETLKAARARTVVLVSTIAVYHDVSTGVDEDDTSYETNLAYGRHRRELEELIADHFPRHLILRLPALFGQGLKKNFLFDLMNPVPSFLKPEPFDRLKAVEGAVPDLLNRYFVWEDAAGMWKFQRALAAEDGGQEIVQDLCRKADISALAFTNADSAYQFYDLSRLWADILCADENDLRSLNLATEPVTAGDIHRHVTGREMTYRDAPVVTQNMMTCHAAHWGRADGYLMDRAEVLARIKALVGDRR